MNGCSCKSNLNIFVCRTDSCGFTGRFIDSLPFVVGALAIIVAGGVARFTTDRLLNRKNAAEADAADFADFVSEATGLVGALFVFIIGVVIVASADKLQAIIVLISALCTLPLVWIVWKFVSHSDPIIAVRSKRGHGLGWRSYTLTCANLAAVVLVFLII
jgi:hypothetical protein